MGVLLHHTVEGLEEGPVLVLAGSLGSTLEMWEPNVPALGRRLRIVRIDQRGHGRSPAPPGPYTIAELADDFLTTLDSLGLRDVAWCGLSMGAMIGMHIASEHPGRISALALCATSARFESAPWRQRIADVEEHGLGPLAPRIVGRWFTPAWAAAHPVAVARAREWVGDTTQPGYLGCCEAIATWDHVDRLDAIQAPTLVLAGEADPVAPAEPHAELLRSAIDGARLETLPASHLLNIEAAERVNRLVVDHVLDAVQGPGSSS